jgi:hypothetical protein
MMKTSLTEEVTQAGDGHVYVEVKESGANFLRKSDSKGHPIGHGEFFLRFTVIALQQAVYIPLSLASGKKPTGFVYQIEGTAPGSIDTTDISCLGDGVTKITLGTLLYAKIPQGSTANFRIVVDMKGEIGKTYRIVINRINYKLNPTDARYKKLDTAIGTKTLEFR